MSENGGARVLPWAILGAAVALYVGWALAPASGLYTQLLSPHRLLALAAVLKLVYLLAGAAWAFACRDRLEADNPRARRGSFSRSASSRPSPASSAWRPSRWSGTRRLSRRSPTSSTCWPTRS